MLRIKNKHSHLHIAKDVAGRNPLADPSNTGVRESPTAELHASGVVAQWDGYKNVKKSKQGIKM